MGDAWSLLEALKPARPPLVLRLYLDQGHRVGRDQLQRMINTLIGDGPVPDQLEVHWR